MNTVKVRDSVFTKIEILELLVVKLKENRLYADAKEIEGSISEIKKTKKFYSSKKLKSVREVDRLYISSIGDYIRDNSRVDESILAQRFNI